MNLEQRVEKIQDDLTEIKVAVAKIISNQESHDKTFDKHDKNFDEHGEKIEGLEAHKNKTLGVVGLLGIFLGGIATWIVTHLFGK